MEEKGEKGEGETPTPHIGPKWYVQHVTPLVTGL